MKKTWMAVCLAALLTLPLAGCAGSRTNQDMTGTAPSAQPSQTAPSPSSGDRADPNPGDDDLAGADGIVGENGVNGTGGAGNTGNGNVPGQADNSPLEDVGDGVRDTLDDMGAAARRVGDDAQRAITR